jgi:PhzF family phenazine biosynthesis protein
VEERLMGMKFFIADAFTEILFGGNPAGVVWLEDGAFPDESIMRKTAAELRYSETVFIQRRSSGTFASRYFTPTAEVDLCGHATIGGFYALMTAGILPEKAAIRNETKAGALTVCFQPDGVFMEMGTPAVLASPPDHDPSARSRLYAIMGIPKPDEAFFSRFPVRIISTGLPDIILPVEDEAALAAIRPDFSALAACSEACGVVGVHAFAADFSRTQKDKADSGALQVHVRNFAPLYGIDEEAATGTANGALAWYLAGHGFLPSVGGKLLCIQGESMGRTSMIHCQTSEQEERPLISVGGRAVILAEGELHI